MRKILIAFVLLAGCYRLGETPVPVNDPAPAPSGAGEIALAAAELWGEVLGAELVDPPTPLFYTGECLEFGEPDNGFCPQGLYFEQSDVVYLLLAENWIAVTSHEILHWSLEQTTGDLDVFHEGSAWARSPEVLAALTPGDRTRL